MGAAQAKLSEQSEIIDLLRVLEQNRLMKERQEAEFTQLAEMVEQA